MLISHQETTGATCILRMVNSNSLHAVYVPCRLFLLNKLYLGRHDSSIGMYGIISLLSYKPIYCCLISVTSEARTAAGTRVTTVMAIDAGLGMRSAKNGRAYLFIPLLCRLIRHEQNGNFLLVLTVDRTVTGCSTKYGCAQYIVFGTRGRSNHFIEDMNVLHVLDNCSGLCMVTILQ